MNLYEKVMTLYPDLTQDDFVNGNVYLRNDSDGRGDYICDWKHPTFARPTQEQLDELDAE